MENVIRRRPTADPAHLDSRVMRCAFTGHRPQKMPFGYNELDPRCIDFKARLRETIEMLIWEGFSHFLSGGAIGMDMYAAEIVLELRQKYPWIGLEMVIPYDSQEDRWEEVYQTRHAILLEAADILTCTGHEYTKGALFRRNRYLVDNADLLLAAYDGKPGGTQMTCEYAKKVGVEVCKIPPVVEKPMQPAPLAAEKEDKEVGELLRRSLELFEEVQQSKSEPGKTYSVDCPFYSVVKGMDVSLNHEQSPACPLYRVYGCSEAI